jgi:hypothetical protein
MKKVKFKKDHEIHWARYSAGDEPEQWFANEDADRLEAEGIVEITETDEYTKLLLDSKKPHTESATEE